jgi:hypothetical protein
MVPSASVSFFLSRIAKPADIVLPVPHFWIVNENRMGHGMTGPCGKANKLV